MSRIFVAGLGAVSPAGWNVAALREALDKGEPLPVQSMERPGWEKPLRARLVPNPGRASGISRASAPAAHESGHTLRGGGGARSHGRAAGQPGCETPAGLDRLPAIRLRELLLPVF